MNILTLCGSIRRESSNHALLKAAEVNFPATAMWTHFEIKQLPFFDPQLQFGAGIPEAVKNLRQQAEKSDFIFIATPEYAHGIPGILKNALEWLVCEETMKKQVVVLIGTPSGGEYVKEYLLETLRTMDMLVSPEQTLVVRAARNQITSLGEVTDAGLRTDLKIFLQGVL